MMNNAGMKRVGRYSGVLAAVWLICLALAPLASSVDHRYVLHIFPFRFIAFVLAVTATALSSRWWAVLAIVIFAIAMIRPI